MTVAPKIPSAPNTLERECSYCGSRTSESNGAFVFRDIMPYGSKRDGFRTEFVLCLDCFDKLCDKIYEQGFIKDPIKREEENY